ncbi:MAG: hypothetical protein H6Q00_1606 [Holophagaceae bacterium]|nr:hypothetical protein [Holophagaceae bacterium]
MRAHTFVSLMLVAMPWLSVPVQAQEEQEKPKGIFGLLNKLTNPAGSGFVYKDVSGKEWKTKNFKHISSDEGKKFQAFLDEKKGFRHYTFGMTVEDFLKTAKAHKESFQRGDGIGLEGDDSNWLQASGPQYLNNVDVTIRYGFYKRKLVWVNIRSGHRADMSKNAAELAYQGIAETYGPGLAASRVESKGMGDARPGVLWFSDKAEIHFFSAFDPSAANKAKSRLDAGVAEEHPGNFNIEFRSRDLLADYYSTVRKSAKAGM